MRLLLAMFFQASAQQNHVWLIYASSPLIVSLESSFFFSVKSHKSQFLISSWLSTWIVIVMTHRDIHASSMLNRMNKLPGNVEKQAQDKCYQHSNALPPMDQTLDDLIFLIGVLMSFGLLYIFSNHRRLPHSKLSWVYDLFDLLLCRRSAPDPTDLKLTPGLYHQHTATKCCSMIQ